VGRNIPAVLGQLERNGKMTEQNSNDLGLDGIEFVEFGSDHPRQLENLFLQFGFSKLMRHKTCDILYFKQNDIHFLLNEEANSLARDFVKAHGPSISAMGWRVRDAEKALRLAVARGATASAKGDYLDGYGRPIPAIEGIGGSLIYFIDDYGGRSTYQEMGFVDLTDPVRVPDKGFSAIDHLTNNVEKGQMQRWADFYKTVFGFTEVRYFDIRGLKTGLVSYALRSPCGKFCIPINEGTEDRSQINEYLREYRGPGIQHLAFLTSDILASLRALEGSSIQTLDIDDEYYRDIFARFPEVTENHEAIRRFNVLIDGDRDGYLLQIFTKNLIGPIFIEIIQRKNHDSFGEGNFGALFRSIEKDQEKRGVI
jgi:4-hydroxyphenylpyruvate dioxygenase